MQEEQQDSAPTLLLCQPVHMLSTGHPQIPKSHLHSTVLPTDIVSPLPRSGTTQRFVNPGPSSAEGGAKRPARLWRTQTPGLLPAHPGGCHFFWVEGVGRHPSPVGTGSASPGLLIFLCFFLFLFFWIFFDLVFPTLNTRLTLHRPRLLPPRKVASAFYRTSSEGQ